jgi:hypothetical protein
MTLREPKKTESLEVRVSHETKTAFMAACAKAGVSASTVLRRCMARHIAAADRAPSRRKELAMLSDQLRRPIPAAAAATLTGLAATMLVTPAQAAIDPRVAAVFDWMDADGNGGIDAGEFAGTNTNMPSSDAIVIEMTGRTPPSPGETRAGLFRRLDTNHDSLLTADELAGGTSVTVAISPAVAAADANGDARVGEAELAAWLTTRRATAGVPDPSAGVGLMVHRIIAAADTDENGTIALADLVRRQP